MKDETEEKLKKLKVWENTGNRGQEVISLKAGIENDKKNPKKFKRMTRISKAQVKDLKARFKQGIEIPRNYSDAIRLDKKNGNTKW